MVYVLSVPGQEGNDRKTIRVDQEEQQKINELHGYTNRHNMRSVLIFNTACPVTGWALSFWDAMFWVSLPGMQGAAAIADILCGKVNPSGRLPVSFPYSENDMPSYLNFPGDGMTVMYGEGIFVGYRYYTTRYHRNQDDQFAEYVFGFGLSYSEFEVRNLRIESGSIETGLDLLAEVENTGEVARKTVIQVYVHDPVSTLIKPVCSLCAFRKVYLEPHQTVTLRLHIDRRAFESWDPDLHKWTLEDGNYILNATEKTPDAINWRNRADITLRCDAESPYSWGVNTSIKEIYETPELNAALHRFMEAHGLAWEHVLTTYEYTAKDSVSLMLKNTGCPDKVIAVFAEILRKMRYRKP
ncbi:MAG: glycoside hydrolase family 3 C-terminal domain-containing protein [Oscillospiraceae bacterium]|nr:glycoside hydrolase family 3 C-terminal domain-containing protein [Oscillospiraceae bacterium]